MVNTGSVTFKLYQGRSYGVTCTLTNTSPYPQFGTRSKRLQGDYNQSIISFNSLNSSTDHPILEPRPPRDATDKSGKGWEGPHGDSGNHYILTIKDNGTGISASVDVYLFTNSTGFMMYRGVNYYMNTNNIIKFDFDDLR